MVQIAGGSGSLIVDDTQAQQDAAFDRGLLSSHLKNIDINKKARAYQKLTGDPLAFEAFTAADGDAAKAQNFLAYGQMARRATVRPDQVSNKMVDEYAKNYYEQQAGRPLTEEEQERLNRNLEDKKNRSDFKNIIAQQQTANNFQSLNAMATNPGAQKAADFVNSRSLKALNDDHRELAREINDSARTSKNLLNTTIPRVQKALESGKIPSGRQYFLSGFTDAQRRQVNASPELDVFLSGIKTFLKDARKTFGGRVTNFEVSQYLQAFPNLEQTAEGRLAVLAAVKESNQLAVREGELINEITARYRAEHPENAAGYPPNLDQQLADALDNDPKTKAIYDRYKASIAQLDALREIGGNKKVRQEFNSVLNSYYDGRGENNIKSQDIKRVQEAFQYLKSNPDQLKSSRYLQLTDGSTYVFGKKSGKLNLQKLKREGKNGS